MAIKAFYVQGYNKVSPQVTNFSSSAKQRELQILSRRNFLSKFIFHYRLHYYIMTLCQKKAVLLEPYSYWTLCYHLEEAQYLQLNVSNIVTLIQMCLRLKQVPDALLFHSLLYLFYTKLEHL